MVDEEDKKEDLFDKEDKFDAFTPEGEALGYISLDQARVLTIQHARENTDFYGRSYQGVELYWEVVSQEETEDYYEIRLSYRPARGFRGEPGIERFTIDKEGGSIELRQIVSEPAGKPRPRLLYALVGMVVVVGAVVGVLFATGILPPEAETTEAPPPAAVPISTTVKVPVAPNEPAVLVSPQGAVTVRLAAGSVEDPVDLSYRKIEPTDIPPCPPASFCLTRSSTCRSAPRPRLRPAR